MYLFVPLSIPYFYFAFRFLWIHATGLLEAFHSYSQLISDTGVSTSLFSDTESPLDDVDSCDEDGDEADEDVVEEELADIPGNTNGTQFNILQSILLPFLMRCGF